MPLFYLICPKCLNKSKRLLSVEDSKKEIPCSRCKNILERDFQDPSLVVKETIDNGIQPRRVEQIAGAGELIDERARDSKKKQGL